MTVDFKQALSDAGIPTTEAGLRPIRRHQHRVRYMHAPRPPATTSPPRRRPRGHCRAAFAAGKLVYTHDSSENFTDSFRLVPIDDQGITAGTATATNHTSTGTELIVPITLTPINDAHQYQHKSQLISGEAGAITEGATATIGGARPRGYRTPANTASSRRIDDPRAAWRRSPPALPSSRLRHR